MSDPLRVVIGFDRSEVPAYHTLCNSIITRASRPVEIIPLHEPTLRADNIYWREDRGSTDFAFSRFLTPYLCNYKGFGLFIDCDMVVMDDITDLFSHITQWNAVSVCKHEYTPTSATKFGGNKQTSYPRKLWSAVTLFNCSNQKVKNLTPKMVNEMSGSDLHRFTWVGNDNSRIGEIPEEWHWIPNHSESRVNIEEAALIHYTEGGPWHDDYKDRGSQAEKIWLEEHAKIISRSALK